MRSGIVVGGIVLVLVASVVMGARAEAQSIFNNTRVLNNNAWTDLGDDVHPDVTTDGAGNWMAVWTSRDSLGGTIGGEGDIVFSRSTDGALTWSAPAALNTTAFTDSARDEHPTIATDGAGNWIAVWDRIDPYGGDYGNDYDVFFAKFTDAGLSWSDPVALNPNASDDSGGEGGPSIIMDGTAWIVSWIVSGGATGADADLFVVYSTDAASTWSTPSAINPNAYGDRVYDWESDLASDGKGTWVATWRITSCCEPQRIATSRSTDYGSTWSEPTVLLWGWGFDTQVETDGKGNWVAAWSTSGASGFQDIFYARSQDGLAWERAAVLSTGDGGDHHVSLETDRAGNWVAVWEYGHYATREIRTSTSTDAGATWSLSVPLNGYSAAHTRLFSYPRVVSDRRGDWVALWTSNNSLGNAIGNDLDILFASGWAPANTPPVAVAGPDQTLQCTTAEGTATAALDGSGSWDVDSDPLSFVWSEGGVTLSEEQLFESDFTLGEHPVQLTVNDGLAADGDELIVSIEATIEGLSALTQELIGSGDLAADLGDRLLTLLLAAMESDSHGKTDRAEHYLDQFKHKIDKEADKTNIDTGLVSQLTGAADCIRIFTL